MPASSTNDPQTFGYQQPTGIQPRSAYIHIPFCRHRCGYCNFTLVAGRDYLADRFLAAIERELDLLTQRYELDTLFLGGGTPSHLSTDNLKRLKNIVSARFDYSLTAEVTAECNPNDLDAEKSDALADFGVNRISLGVQSLNGVKLARLERDHTLNDVRNAIDHARKFARSVSMDLIFAAPEETLEEWQQDLRTALQFLPDHLSTYELTYEKGTQFWNRRSHGNLTESDEELRAEMYESANGMIADAGLQPYEISSFALPDHVCQHNESYWTGRPYFAFGPGASRYIDGVRQTNHSSTMQYLKRLESQQSPVASSEKLSQLDSAKELLAIGLRRVVGVNEKEFERLTNSRVVDILPKQFETWIEKGLLVKDSGRWRLTFPGRMLCDRIAGEIVG